MHGFEIGNVLISMGTIKRILKNLGATSLKRQFWNEDRLLFRYDGEEWVVHEPYGDNSRYWIGPKYANNHVVDVAPIHDAFVAYQYPVIRLWSTIRQAISQ